jgi:hypothetical protein
MARPINNFIRVGTVVVSQEVKIGFGKDLLYFLTDSNSIIVLEF